MDFAQWRFRTVKPRRTHEIPGVGLDRPNLIGDPNFNADRSRNDQVGRWFHTAVFQAPPVGRYGNAGRNILSGPGSVNTDIGLFKNFVPGRERWGRLQFRTEVFNVFNRVNFNNPTASLNAGAN